MSDESINLHRRFNAGINYIDNARIRLKFDASCLKQEKIFFTHKTILTSYIVYEIDFWDRNLDSKFTLGNSLLGAAKLTKNADPDRYSFSGYVLDLMHVDFFNVR